MRSHPLENIVLNAFATQGYQDRITISDVDEDRTVTDADTPDTGFSKYLCAADQEV